MLPMCSTSPRLHLLQHFNVFREQRVSVVTCAIGFDVSMFPMCAFLFRSALIGVLCLLLMIHVLVRRVVPRLVTCLVLFHLFCRPVGVFVVACVRLACP